MAGQAPPDHRAGASHEEGTIMADRQEHVDGGDGSRPRIVVGVDGSEDSGRALDWAAKEAVGRGAVLDIRTFYEPGYTHITAEEVARTMERTVEEAAARAAAVAPGVVTTTAVREASPAAALLEAAEGADLLVVGSRDLGAFSGLLLGSVSHKVVLHAPCSVAVIH